MCREKTRMGMMLKPSDGLKVNLCHHLQNKKFKTCMQIILKTSVVLKFISVIIYRIIKTSVRMMLKPLEALQFSPVLI